MIPTDSGTLVLQSFYEWMPERAPVLTGVVAVQRGQARAAASLASMFGAPAHADATDGHLRIRIARIYAAMQEALRRSDWVAFGQAMAELRRLSIQR